MNDDDVKTKPYVKRPPFLDEEPKTVQRDTSELRKRTVVPELSPESKTRPASPTLKRLIEEEKARARQPPPEDEVTVDVPALDDDPDRF